MKTDLQDIQVTEKIPACQPLEVETTVKCTVPGDWLAMCTLWSDIFASTIIGYWARGVQRDNERGWLVWEFGEDERWLPVVCRTIPLNEDMFHAEAIQAWKAGKSLPPHYHALTKAAAIKGYLAMCRNVKWGFDWYQNGDGTSYDVAIQLALLGEVKYG